MAHGIDFMEEAVLSALSECLERALELACDAHVLQRLGEIAGLAADAAALARSGELLLRPNQPLIERA